MLIILGAFYLHIDMLFEKKSFVLLKLNRERGTNFVMAANNCLNSSLWLQKQVPATEKWLTGKKSTEDLLPPLKIGFTTPFQIGRIVMKQLLDAINLEGKMQSLQKGKPCRNDHAIHKWQLCTTV